MTQIGKYGLMLGAFVVLVGGGLTWLIYTQPSSQSAGNYAAQQLTSPSPAPAPADPMASWKTETSSLAKFSFKHPSEWTVRRSGTSNGLETISLIGPNAFALTLTSFTSESAYGQDSLRSNPQGSCQACLATYASEEFAISGFGQAKASAVAYGAGGGSMDRLLVTTMSGSIFLYSPKASNVITAIDAYVGGKQEESTIATAAKFRASAEAQTATRIIKSLTY